MLIRLLNLSHWTVFVVLVLFNACANKPLEQQDTFKRNSQLIALQQWQAKGKMGLNFPYQDKVKLVSASFEWQQKNQDFEILFFGPLGMNEFKLEKLPTYTVLTNHKGQKYYSESPESLFLEHAGVDVPWTLMTYWIKGVPAPKFAKQITNNNQTGLPEVLVQADWKVSYISWFEHNGQLMPGKLKISRDNMHATLVIREWIFEEMQNSE